MFDHDEVLNENIEDQIPVGDSFAATPCLNQEAADFIGFALAQGNVDLSVIALEKVEKQLAFLSSVQARLALHIDSLESETNEKSSVVIERGTAHRISLARHRSPRTSLAYLRRMRHVCNDMPYLFSRFESGDLNESMMMAIAGPFDETSSYERQLFDDQFRNHPSMFDGASVVQARDIARQFVNGILDDERGEEMEKKTKHRGLSFRSGKDCINMNACLPVEVGIAVDKGLEAAAQKAKKAGDPRTIAQLKVDIMIARLTGNNPEAPLPIKLHVNLVMTDMALLMDGHDPASIPGYGSVPASYAARLLESYAETDGNTPASELSDIQRRIKMIASVRRLYVLPGGHDLVAMDSKERLFKGMLRKFIELRDPYCRTPFCTNKPRHADHITQKSRGGPTSAGNGCMKCASCNLAKEARGWKEETVRESPHQINIQPGGSVDYESYPPPLLGTARPERAREPDTDDLDSILKNRPRRIIQDLNPDSQDPAA